MADSPDDIGEISALLLRPETLQHKSLLYLRVLQFQEQSVNDPHAIETLALHSHLLVSIIASDIFSDDEETAALALKCLGFMTYHPYIVSSISDDDTSLVIESLVKLITITKMKAIYNLGAWCIAIQQLNTSLIGRHMDSLLRAVTHALDNLVGSMSTTYEAMQAVIKLATQHREKMREMSHIWAPLIYRRLLSADKREKDIAERCLLKIKPCILPPPLILSKGLVWDIKKRLLPGMKEMIGDPERQAQIIQAWRWYILLLGSTAIKHRNLLNEMLKIPEQTLSNTDPQVQVASLVAWEALVDALTEDQILRCNMEKAHDVFQETGNQLDCLLKSVKLLMTPLVAILSRRKYELSVHLSCLKTWRYLLHRLDLSVNYDSVVKNVLEPVLEIVFRVSPGSRNAWLWNSCVDILDDFISSKYRNNDSQSAQVGADISGKDSWQDYPIKWRPWDCSKLGFHLKMIHNILNQAFDTTATLANSKLIMHAALRIFKSVMQGIQVELKVPSAHFDEVMLCLSTIWNFLKELCEDVTSKLSAIGTNDLIFSIIQFVEAARDVLEPSIVESPLYRVPLDFKYIKDLESDSITEYSKTLGISCVSFMDNVSPSVYLSILYHSLMVQLVLKFSEMEWVPDQLRNYSKFIFSASDPLENLQPIICLLYMHHLKFVDKGFSLLKIWMVIAKGLKVHIAVLGDLKKDYTGSLVVCSILCYPFVTCHFRPNLVTKVNTSSTLDCLISLGKELELLKEVWNSLYECASCASWVEGPTINGFAEGFCQLLMRLPRLNPNSLLNGEHQNFVFLVFGEVAISVLKQIKLLERNQNHCSNIKHSLDLIARFLTLSLAVMSTKQQQSELSVVFRTFATLAEFVDRLRLKHDMLLLLETLSDPLLQWLLLCSSMDKGMQEEISRLHILWTKILDCMQRIQPPVTFNSVLLEVQAPLLLAALDHPYYHISAVTIAFWNSTYGEQNKLNYPQSLLAVLDKLFREGKIMLPKGSSGFTMKSNSLPTKSIGEKKTDRLTARHERFPKGVELAEQTENDDLQLINNLHSGLKRKRSNLRTAQQEKVSSTDSSGSDNNSVKTAINVDFTREALALSPREKLRNPMSIIKMLRRVG